MVKGKNLYGLAAAAMLIGSGLADPSAQAAYIVTLEQVGTSVLATGSGTIDTTDLSFYANGASVTQAIDPSGGFIALGSGPVADYTGITGPASFGTGGLTFSSNTGDPVAVSPGPTDYLILPTGYTGSTLSDSATYFNQTFTSLGVTPGAYTWTWGTGTADADSFTLDIDPAPAPPIGHGLPVLLAVGAMLALSLLRRPRGLLAAIAVATPAIGLLVPLAKAAYIVTLEQVGTSVVATGSGTIDPTDLSLAGSNTYYSWIVPSSGQIIVGPSTIGPYYADYYGLATGPTNFGSGGYSPASIGSGDLAGFLAFRYDDDSDIFVPDGYVSGSAPSGAATWENATFASLGVTPGTYTWAWGSGGGRGQLHARYRPGPGAAHWLGRGGLGGFGALVRWATLAAAQQKTPSA